MSTRARLLIAALGVGAIALGSASIGYNMAESDIPNCAEDELLDATDRPWREVEMTELRCIHIDAVEGNN